MSYMNLYYNQNNLEVGIDEVARGCLFGRVYTAAVIWTNDEIENKEFDLPIIKDSKKLSKKKREELFNLIKEYALDYSITYIEPDIIDNFNILNSTLLSMHNALDNLNIQVDNILVDGNRFNPYITSNGILIPHKCIIDGDEKYQSIACASILAKVAHDHYIEELCQKFPDLNEKYDLLSNMGYGTKKHQEGIIKYGLSSFHRKTFGICKKYV